MLEYIVHAQAEDKLIGPGRRSSVYEIPNPEGFKYCFEVPTSFLLLRHNGYIFATGNTGKTYVEIIDFAQQHKKDSKAMLVVCPKSLMKAAWANDIKKFAPHLRVSIAWAKNRAEALAAEADVYIINHDGVKDLLKYKPAFWKKFNRIVIDESTAFKHHTSQRSRAVIKLAKYFEWRRAMSGTATSNGICDLWHQMFIVDDGKRLGKSFFGFRSACCNPVQTGLSAQHVKWEDKPGIETAVSALIADITIRHKFEDCVDIPKNHMYALTFELPARHMKTYRQLEAESIARFETGNVTAINGAVLATKLLQTASGAVYDDRGGYARVDTERYEMVMDLVEERPHSIVFYQWEHQLQELLALAKSRKITHVVWDPDRPEIEQEYQAGFYQVLFAHPASAGHGLTLTRGLATIWASPTYNLEHFAQGYKRIYRIGQKQKTETIVIVAEGTIDEKVWAACQAKRIRMDDLMEELKCSRL